MRNKKLENMTTTELRKVAIAVCKAKLAKYLESCDHCTLALMAAAYGRVYDETVFNDSAYIDCIYSCTKRKLYTANRTLLLAFIQRFDV